MHPRPGLFTVTNTILCYHCVSHTFDKCSVILGLGLFKLTYMIFFFSSKYAKIVKHTDSVGESRKLLQVSVAPEIRRVVKGQVGPT